MATFDFQRLTEPLSSDAACGPDLDLEGDPDFLNFVARAEGLFPASFFTRDSDGKLQAFDRTTIDFASEFKTLDQLLGSTRDLRLLTIYGRLLALNRDLPGFASCLDGTAALLRDHWADVNPKGEDGDFTLRAAVLQAFDDNPSVVLPLQHIPLATSRRAGAISYRTIMVASGDAKPREDETPVDRGTIDRAFAESDVEALKGTAGNLRRILDAAKTIQLTSIENAGYDQAVTLDKLPALAQKMLETLEAALAARDPGAVQPPAPVASGATEIPAAGGTVQAVTPVAMGRIASIGDARKALAAIDSYFRRFEPSSPAAILVQQAERLIGKSFPEVVRLLVPALADSAKIQLGQEKLFGLTFDQVPDPGETWSGAEDAAGTSSDAWSSNPSGDTTEAGTAFAANTRADAAVLLDQVSMFYRSAEPSSPIPLLTERARSMLDRDFLTILKDVLPEIVPRDE